jgi:ribosomal protein S21
MLNLYQDEESIEEKIRRVKKEINKSGLSRKLRLRSIAKASNRRKAKERLAAQRRARVERKRAMWSMENSYDRNIRRQDKANRIFNARRAIDPVGRNQ